MPIWNPDVWWWCLLCGMMSRLVQSGIGTIHQDWLLPTGYECVSWPASQQMKCCLFKCRLHINGIAGGHQCVGLRNRLCCNDPITCVFMDMAPWLSLSAMEDCRLCDGYHTSDLSAHWSYWGFFTASIKLALFCCWKETTQLCIYLQWVCLLYT